MKSYIFRVELSEEPDGRWIAVVPALQACYTWGHSRDEALLMIQDAAKCCVEELLAHGEVLPESVEIIDAPVASVVV